MTPPREVLHRASSFLLVALLALPNPGPADKGPPESYLVCTRVLPDGELERRVQRGRITALETTVERPSGSEGRALTLLQVTDGRHFIQMIYDDRGSLRDCESIKSPESVERFYRSLEGGGDCRNATRVESNRTLTDYPALRKECRALHKRVRQSVTAQHHKPKQFREEDEEGGGVGRAKRELFLYPGTNWCGSGSNARKFNELGYNAAADRCCRDHDHCPYTIEGFTRKFNFFNFRFHTISHCDCDERFRACLKLSSTAAGNMVGKLFFNVVQTKCFLFKHVKKCAKRSWWGKCLKFDKEKMAVLRDALKY